MSGSLNVSDEIAQLYRDVCVCVCVCWCWCVSEGGGGGGVGDGGWSRNKHADKNITYQLSLLHVFLLQILMIKKQLLTIFYFLQKQKIIVGLLYIIDNW